MTVLTDRVLYSIPEAMALLGLSRTVIYEQIRASRLRTVSLGRRRYVVAHALDDYVQLLEQEAERRGRRGTPSISSRRP